MDISRISWPSLLLQTLRSISRISGWVAGAIERNRRSKRDRDRWCPSRSPRRTPLFRKRATLPSRNRVLGQRRSSARRRTLAYPPSLRRCRFSLWRTSTIDTRRRISRLESRGDDDDDVGRNHPFLNTGGRDNYFYRTLPFLHLFSFPNPAQFELRSPFCPNRFATVSSFRSIIVSFSFSATSQHLIRYNALVIIYY